MDSSNLTSLPEEGSEETHNLHSAFSSIPARLPIQTSSQKYAPLDWSDYFDREDDIQIPDSDDVFHVYMAGTEGPVVFCLHGGGYCGLSFALAASKIKEKARIVAMDLRGHGKSATQNDVDLSIETLCGDVFSVLKTMYGDAPPAIVLVGHSMGGAVAVHVAAKKSLPSLAGLVVVDVVEGSAMASLIHMQKILSNRMQHFSTPEKAVTNAQNFFPFCDKQPCSPYHIEQIFYYVVFYSGGLVSQERFIFNLSPPPPPPNQKKKLILP
uniref:protein phosphatase methylesterase-1 n=1 Tax=Nicotiana tabacum TaxID=4097 RepID=A0A1S4D2U2_TOBAC|nr:PREDICTED: protein phosphatase methylesterase 1-like [Nicotiana tabacum]